TTLMAPTVVRLLLGDPTGGDRNGDGKLNLAVYASDESFGRSTSADLKASLQRLRPEAGWQQMLHPRDADPATYHWAEDLTALAAGKPDLIVVATFPLLHAAIVSAAKTMASPVPLFHFHNMRNQRAIQAAGEAADGQEGISHVMLEDTESGATFLSDFEQATGVPVAFRDAIFYDGAFSLMLAALIATRDLDDPAAVTGAQLRDALPRTSDPAGEVIRTGAAEFARAIGLVQAGRPINYQGASSPLDYDATRNVRTRLAHFR